MEKGNCREGLGEELLEQHMLAVPSAYTSGLIGVGVAMPSGLNLEPSFVRHQHQQSTRASGGTRFRDDNNVVVVEGNDHHHQLHLMSNHRTANTNSAMPMSSSSSATSGIINNISDSVHMREMYTALGQLHSHVHAPHAYAHSFRTTVPPPAPSLLLPHQQHQPPATPAAAVAQPPGIRPRVRARRGQATDPHSIAERLRRERIAERMKALQELVPTTNKTDRAAMLDEIVDYVKFLRLQVKVLSMSRLGGAGAGAGAGAIAQLVADVPLSALKGEDIEGGSNQQEWSNDGIEQEVAKLMEEDVGAAMQLLQSKALCIMPASLASAILCTPRSEAPKSNSHS